MLLVDCTIPRVAAEALELNIVLERAAVSDIPDGRLEYQLARDGTDRVRIVCSIPIAYFLIAELRRLALTLQPALTRRTVVALGLAVAALFAGVDDARRRTRPAY